MFEIKFINDLNNKELCTYNSFISIDELSETCGLLMYEHNIKNVRIDIIENDIIKLQYLKEEGQNFKLIQNC